MNLEDALARLGRLLDEIEALIEQLLDVAPERARRARRRLLAEQKVSPGDRRRRIVTPKGRAR